MKKTIFALVLTLIVGAAFAQSAANGNVDQAFLNDFVRRKFTTADGLPGMTITDIMQDKKGYIYIGTYDGLVRFDGVEFVTFNRNYDKNTTLPPSAQSTRTQAATFGSATTTRAFLA